MTTNHKSTLSRPLLVVAALALLAGTIAAGWRWADGGGEPSTASRPAEAMRPQTSATLAPLPPPASIARAEAAPTVDATPIPQDHAGRKPMQPPPLLTPPGPPPPMAASGQPQLPSPEELAAIPPPPEIAAGLANPPPDILRGMQNPPPEMVKGLKTPPPWVKQMPLK